MAALLFCAAICKHKRKEQGAGKNVFDLFLETDAWGQIHTDGGVGCFFGNRVAFTHFATSMVKQAALSNFPFLAAVSALTAQAA